MKFIDDNFIIPENFKTDKFLLRMLSVKDVVKDYDAVMTSINYLQKLNPFWPESTWPKSDLTFEQDLIDLWWHQKEFQRRSTFAYTVMNLDESVCLWCLYIFPSLNNDFDAEITMWVRENELKNWFDEYFFTEVKKWIKEKWNFKNPAYPWRDISWNDYLKV